MISKLSLDHILFLDIETVPQQESFDKLEPIDQQLYTDKTKYQRKDDVSPEAFYDRAGIWAEFGKIICISVVYFVNRADVQQFRNRSFTGGEKELL